MPIRAKLARVPDVDPGATLRHRTDSRDAVDRGPVEAEVAELEGPVGHPGRIAVELPESEGDSSHYRILFLAALVLFLITFAFNTAAEVVRQRLRQRYGNL